MVGGVNAVFDSNVGDWLRLAVECWSETTFLSHVHRFCFSASAVVCLQDCEIFMAHKGEIGLHSGTVELIAHHPKWAEYFSKEKQLLFKILGEKVLDIRHIGSTSIPGIRAKPILDILAGVKILADVEAFTQDLSKIGYEDKGNGGVPGRRYFVKGTEAKRTHHLNFCEMNSLFWRSHLAFRDYLERHPEIAGEYSALKQGLADRFPHDGCPRLRRLR